MILAAASSGGNWVEPGVPILVGLLEPDAQGLITNLYIEAVDQGSWELGDVRIKAQLIPGPDAPAYESLSDRVVATVFHIETIHPQADDFVTGHEGKIMISTKHCTTNTPNRYYATELTARPLTATPDGGPAQDADTGVYITAYILPVIATNFPPPSYPVITAYFEVTDPDDRSPYDGKVHPTNTTNWLPNDNRDPAKRMWWGASADPAGYQDYQQACLTTNANVAAYAVINGQGRFAAQTRLRHTRSYAGDNYQVRATLRKPDYGNEGGRFDTHTGMNASNHQFHASTIRETIPLVAWKRVYIEQDNMYTLGATIVSNAPAQSTEIYVDSNVDFGIGDPVTLFWKSGGTILQENGTVTNLLPSRIVLTQGISQTIPPYAGIKPQGHTATYTLTRDYLEQTFGSCPQGTDGGAFIEFRDAPTGHDDGVPKYRWMPSPQSSDNTLAYGYYINMWFDLRLQAWLYAGNVLYLHSGDRGYDNQGPIQGWQSGLHGSSIVFTQNGQVDVTFREKTVVHEIGHRFGLSKSVGGAYDYIDYDTGKKSYSGDTYCIMNYRSLAASNATHAVEFSIEALLEGSHPGTDNSLRTVSDR